MPTLQVTPRYQPALRELGLDLESLFTDSRIHVWRSIPERENCTLDATLADGRCVRFHIKRHRASIHAAAAEANAIHMLENAAIPTTPLVAFGNGARCSVLVTEELSGFEDAEKLVQRGLAFEKLLNPTADLAARLHNANLHHRDLYLCHFFAKTAADRVELALIDAARVRKLPRFFRRRWVVKDLSQFWYSTLNLPVSDEQRRQWLERYAGMTKAPNLPRLLSSISRKSNWIARHDAKLRQKHPTRNISIPEASA